MKLLTIFLVLSTILSTTAASLQIDDTDNQNTKMKTKFSFSEIQALTSIRGVSRILAQQNLIAKMTCNKFPRICHFKSSPGPDCCHKKCVNVKTDRLNCGMCGYKCKYTEICCRGKCVNASFDKRHYGGCNIKCKKGQFCAYGICGYAWPNMLVHVMCKYHPNL